VDSFVKWGWSESGAPDFIFTNGTREPRIELVDGGYCTCTASLRAKSTRKSIGHDHNA